MKLRGVSVRQNPKWCSVCGLKIPNLADYRHPLYGTVDHVVPLSKGGSKNANNRAPAHLYCNGKKSNQLILRRDMVLAIQAHIVRQLLAMGFTGNAINLDMARKRVCLPPKERLHGAPYMIQQWEDDGGS